MLASLEVGHGAGPPARQSRYRRNPDGALVTGLVSTYSSPLGRSARILRLAALVPFGAYSEGDTARGAASKRGDFPVG